MSYPLRVALLSKHSHAESVCTRESYMVILSARMVFVCESPKCKSLATIDDRDTSRKEDILDLLKREGWTWKDSAYFMDLKCAKCSKLGKK